MTQSVLCYFTPSVLYLGCYQIFATISNMAFLSSELLPLEIPAALVQYPLLFFIISLVTFIVYSVHSYLRLAHIPGPFLAAFTNIPRFSWVLTYRAHDIHTALHRRYGPLVRFGPNMVSVGDPTEIGTIYGFTKPWLKVSELGPTFNGGNSPIGTACKARKPTKRRN